MKQLYKFALVWLPVVLWALVIFTFSSFPSLKASQVDWQDFAIRKFAHLSEYAILAILLYRSFLLNGCSKFDAGFQAILVCVLYAFSDEFHQAFVPGREPAIRDIAFDATGTTIGIFVVTKLLLMFPKKIISLAKNLSLTP